MTNPQPTPVLEWTKGDRLGKALRMADVSHAEMATILGVSRNTIGNYVADRTPVSDGFLRLWSMRTGVSFDELKYGYPSAGNPDPNGTVTRLYPRQHKSHNWGRRTPLRGRTVASTFETGSGGYPKVA